MRQSSMLYTIAFIYICSTFLFLLNFERFYYVMPFSTIGAIIFFAEARKVEIWEKLTFMKRISLFAAIVEYIAIIGVLWFFWTFILYLAVGFSKSYISLLADGHLQLFSFSLLYWWVPILRMIDIWDHNSKVAHKEKEDDYRERREAIDRGIDNDIEKWEMNRGAGNDYFPYD